DRGLNQNEKRRRLDQTRQAKGHPYGKVFFTFLGGGTFDLEGLAAGAGHRHTWNAYSLSSFERTYLSYGSLIEPKRVPEEQGILGIE
ncbi:hypothetical protein ABES25_24375, partial [Bacillus gobiensis]|uniref:hypothetical protein n=1 Tax=Bacillus gobiensis TaxID=1441095 RepID=UPI003D229A0E